MIPRTIFKFVMKHTKYIQHLAKFIFSVYNIDKIYWLKIYIRFLNDENSKKRAMITYIYIYYYNLYFIHANIFPKLKFNIDI